MLPGRSSSPQPGSLPVPTALICGWPGTPNPCIQRAPCPACPPHHRFRPPRLCPILQGQFGCPLLREACSDPSTPWEPPTSSALDWASPGEVTPASLLVPFRLPLWPFLPHLVLTGTCRPPPRAVFSGCCFPACAVCPSALTFARPGPSSGVSFSHDVPATSLSPLKAMSTHSPPRPSTHIGRL